MRSVRSISILALISSLGPAALADCAREINSYKLVDLGDLMEGQADARALAIDARGRILVSASGDGVSAAASEFLRERSGKAKPVEQSDDGAVRTTKALLDNRLRLIDYIKRKPGYVPQELMTLADRRGEEMTVGDYCKGPDETATLKQFVISPSGEEAAAQFESAGAVVIARCDPEGAAERLFEDVPESELVAINDDGVLAGIVTHSNRSAIWRWNDGVRGAKPIPEDLSDAVIDGIDRAGNIYVSAMGDIKNTSLRYEAGGGLKVVDVLPGPGWNVDWQAVGPCGHLFGRAFHTNLESFLELPAEKQAEIRENTAQFMEFAAQREDAYFVWSPVDGGRFLSLMLPELRDWFDMQILDVNEKGQAVGAARNADGKVRAILFDPD